MCRKYQSDIEQRFYKTIECIVELGHSEPLHMDDVGSMVHDMEKYHEIRP